MKARRLRPRTVYVLFRVFGLESTDPGIKIYVDPWNLYLTGALRFVSLGGYEGYDVDREESSVSLSGLSLEENGSRFPPMPALPRF